MILFNLHLGHVEDAGKYSMEQRGNAINHKITMFMGRINPKGRSAFWLYHIIEFVQHNITDNMAVFQIWKISI